jgi:hypothetical protein
VVVFFNMKLTITSLYWYVILFITFVAWQKQEGDITYLTDEFLFPEDPDDPFFELPMTTEQRSKRTAVKHRFRLWPNGVVPYKISDNYTGALDLVSESNRYNLIVFHSFIFCRK